MDLRSRLQTRMPQFLPEGSCAIVGLAGTLSDNSVRFVIDAPHEFSDVLSNEPVFVSDGGITRLHAASIQLGTEYHMLREFARFGLFGRNPAIFEDLDVTRAFPAQI